MKKQSHFFCITFLFLCLFSVLSYSQLYASSPSVKSGNPKVFYVSKDGDDSNNGESWEQALENIQTAIDWANAYTGDAEVWVAKGVYEPTAYLSDADGQQNADVYKAFIMYSGVNLIGGFYGDEISSEIGADGGRVLSGENTWELANETILDGSSANSYHVVWFGSNGYKNINYNVLSGISIPKELDERTILDGFTITGGFANIDSKIENTTNAKKKFMHLIGGGAAIGGNGEIQNCIVSNNKAKFGGGGMALFDGAIAKNCWINNHNYPKLF